MILPQIYNILAELDILGSVWDSQTYGPEHLEGLEGLEHRSKIFPQGTALVGLDIIKWSTFRGTLQMPNVLGDFSLKLPNTSRLAQSQNLNFLQRASSSTFNSQSTMPKF